MAQKPEGDRGGDRGIRRKRNRRETQGKLQKAYKGGCRIRESAAAPACLCTGGRARTGTVSPPRDFKSLASANFATPAFCREEGPAALAPWEES